MDLPSEIQKKKKKVSRCTYNPNTSTNKMSCKSATGKKTTIIFTLQVEEMQKKRNTSYPG